MLKVCTDFYTYTLVQKVYFFNKFHFLLQEDDNEAERENPSQELNLEQKKIKKIGDICLV